MTMMHLSPKQTDKTGFPNFIGFIGFSDVGFFKVFVFTRVCASDTEGQCSPFFLSATFSILSLHMYNFSFLCCRHIVITKLKQIAGIAWCDGPLNKSSLVYDSALCMII